MFSSTTLVVLFEKKDHSCYSNQVKIYNPLGLHFRRKEQSNCFFSTCHWSTFAVCWKLSLTLEILPLKAPEGVSHFLFQSAFDIEKRKKTHIPHLTQALKKSQIHWSLPSYGFSITAILHPSLGTVVPIDFCNGEGKMFHFFRNDVLKLIKYDMTFMLWKNLYVRTACRVD